MEKVDAVVWSGDVFHIKAPTRTSHALVQRTVDVIREYHRPVYIVPGNHDIQNDRLDTLDRQPLGVLFKAGAIPLVGEGPNDERLFGVPWLPDWSADLPRYMRLWQESEARLMIAHAPIVPPGETRPYEVIGADAWREMMGRPGAVAYGHMHDAAGAFYTGEYDTLFCNYGAISRGSIHESTLSRIPTVAIWESGGDTFTAFEVPYRPASEVFRLADKAVADAKSDRLDAFLDSIGSTTLDAVSIEAVLADLRERGIRKEILAEIEDCFEVTG